MKIREALISNSPSLALQRAAGDEIATLDAQLRRLETELEATQAEMRTLQETIQQRDDHIKELVVQLENSKQ